MGCHTVHHTGLAPLNVLQYQQHICCTSSSPAFVKASGEKYPKRYVLFLQRLHGPSLLMKRVNGKYVCERSQSKVDVVWVGGRGQKGGEQGEQIKVALEKALI